MRALFLVFSVLISIAGMTAFFVFCREFTFINGAIFIFLIFIVLVLAFLLSFLLPVHKAGLKADNACNGKQSCLPASGIAQVAIQSLAQPEVNAVIQSPAMPETRVEGKPAFQSEIKDTVQPATPITNLSTAVRQAVRDVLSMQNGNFSVAFDTPYSIFIKEQHALAVEKITKAIFICASEGDSLIVSLSDNPSGIKIAGIKSIMTLYFKY